MSDDLVFEPHGKVAVITGAAGGIGLGMARAFTGAGMSVVLSDIDADRVEAAAAGLRAAGHDAIGVQADVSQLADVQAIADAAMDTHKRVDVLCNNAGAAIFAKLFNVTVEDWEWTLGVDLWGPIYGTKVFQPLIQQSEGGGHINTTSSVSGLIAGAAAGPYKRRQERSHRVDGHSRAGVSHRQVAAPRICAVSRPDQHRDQPQ